MWHQPDGRQGSLEEYMLPDLEATVSLKQAHMRRVEPGWYYPLHQHALFELNWVLEGRQRIVASGQTIRQETGDIALIVSGERHRADADGPEGMSYFCLHFDVAEPSFRERLFRSPSVLFQAGSPPGRLLAEPMGKLLALTRDAPRPEPTASIRALSALFDICSALGEALGDGGEEAPAARHPFVREMARLLEDAAMPDDGGGARATVAGLARHFGYSAAYCNRVFQEVYGVPPRQYLSRMKLMHAKRLLFDPECAIAEIASRLGYNDVAHMSRQFKRWTGQSPSEYRRALLEIAGMGKSTPPESGKP